MWVTVNHEHDCCIRILKACCLLHFTPKTNGEKPHSLLGFPNSSQVSWLQASSPALGVATWHHLAHPSGFTSGGFWPIVIAIWNIDVLFPLVGWLTTGFYDDRWDWPNRPVYFYQKDIIGNDFHSFAFNDLMSPHESPREMHDAVGEPLGFWAADKQHWQRHTHTLKMVVYWR